MNNSLFYKHFPVPCYMNIDGVGIDISEDAVRVVKIVPGEKGFELKDFGEYAVPDGAFVSGKIRNATAIKAVLSEVKKKHSINFAHTAVSESQSYLSELEVATVKKNELPGSIELQFSEHIPLEVDAAVFDYQVLGPSKKAPGGTAVLVSATSKDLSLSYSELFSSVGITLLSLETDSQAVARAVVPRALTETVMIVNARSLRTGIYINHRFVHFASDVEIGWKEVLYNEPLPQDRFLDLENEINKVLIYWHAFKEKSASSMEKISRIILCGEGAVIPELSGYLASHLRVPVEQANVWSNIFSFDQYIPKMKFEISLRYATAVGLAMRPIISREKEDHL